MANSHYPRSRSRRTTGWALIALVVVLEAIVVHFRPFSLPDRVPRTVETVHNRARGGNSGAHQ